MIRSVPEGDDKPLKYPLMFTKSQVLLVTKIDTAPVFDFDFEKLTGLRIKTRAYFNGDFEILTDLDDEPLGKIHAIGSNIWTADECRFDAVSGTHALYLRYTGTGNSSLLSIEFLHD